MENLLGKTHYPNAKHILIAAGCGGSNGYQRKQWKVELQRFATETGMIVLVCHFPSATNNIE